MTTAFKSMVGFLVSTAVWLFVALDTIIVTALIALVSIFDRRHRVTYRLGNFWGKSIIAVNPNWKLKITGLHHIKKNEAYVLVANHLSLADIVCLFCLGRHFKWLAKRSLFTIPVFGWAMSLLGYIPLKRGKHGSIRDSFKQAQDYLDRDISILIFPEGTRSKTGELGKFMNGAFKLALRAQKPIVPLVISGTEKALTKGSFSMTTTGKGRIAVLPPVSVASYDLEDYDRLRKDVEKLFRDKISEG